MENKTNSDWTNIEFDVVDKKRFPELMKFLPFYFSYSIIAQIYIGFSLFISIFYYLRGRDIKQFLFFPVSLCLLSVILGIVVYLSKIQIYRNLIVLKVGRFPYLTIMASRITHAKKVRNVILRFYYRDRFVPLYFSLITDKNPEKMIQFLENE